MSTPIVKPTVLIVDNHADNVSCLRFLLRDICKLKRAVTGIEALLISLLQPPDLILLSSRLPELNSSETYNWMRAQRVLSDIPIIFLSNNSEITEGLVKSNLLIADYLREPDRRQKCIDYIRHHISLAISERRSLRKTFPISYAKNIFQKAPSMQKNEYSHTLRPVL